MSSDRERYTMRLGTKFGIWLGVLGIASLPTMPALAQTFSVDNNGYYYQSGTDAGGTYIQYYANSNVSAYETTPFTVSSQTFTSTYGYDSGAGQVNLNFASFNSAEFGTLTEVVAGLTTTATVNAQVQNSNATGDTTDIHFSKLKTTGFIDLIGDSTGTEVDQSTGLSLPASGAVGGSSASGSSGTVTNASNGSGYVGTVTAGTTFYVYQDGTGHTVYSNNATDGTTFSGLTATTSVTDSPTLAEYATTSSQTVEFSMDQPTNNVSSPNATHDNGVNLGGNIYSTTTPTVKYYFTSDSTPEPGSFPLAAFGMLSAGGSALSLRRRKSA